jgi:hypothetical protein
MRLSWAGKLLAASVALRLAEAGLRKAADSIDDDSSSGGGHVVLTVAQTTAAQNYADSQGITLREAVLRLYNLNLID